MNLVLKEYLSLLKEKDELDALLLDLLFLDGFETHNTPKTGARQFGVDIFASKSNQAYLLVVKQQNITRNNWDSKLNSVRQSLNEIIDFYIPTVLPQKWHKNQINVVVVTNGYMDETVRPIWEGYVRSSKKASEYNLDFDFWGIDRIVGLASQYAFNEVIFDKSMQSMLRKVLYFIDEDDVEQKYYEDLMDTYISKLSKITTNKKEYRKVFSSLYLCLCIITAWALDQERNKVAIRISEYTLIKYWQFLLQGKLFEKEMYICDLFKLINTYEKCNEMLFQVISKAVNEGCKIPYVNPIEHRLLLYELIGVCRKT